MKRVLLEGAPIGDKSHCPCGLHKNQPGTYYKYKVLQAKRAEIDLLVNVVSECHILDKLTDIEALSPWTIFFNWKQLNDLMRGFHLSSVRVLGNSNYEQYICSNSCGGSVWMPSGPSS